MKRWTLFDSLLFLYFFTLHADQLHVAVGGANVRVNNLIAVAVFAFFFIRFRDRLFRIDRTLCILLLLLTATLTLSCLLSAYTQRCCLFLGWYGFILLMYFLLPYLLMRYYEHKKCFSLYLLSFVCVGIYAALQLVLSLIGWHDPFAQQYIAGDIVRPNAFSYEPSFYALYMTPCIVLVNYHFLSAREQPFYCFKQLTYPKIIGMNFLYFMSTSTSTVFAWGIFCFFLLFISQTRRHLWKYGLVFTSLFLLLGLISPFLIKTFFLKFFFHGFMAHGSFYERWMGIENAWHVFQAHPYFGVGLGGYPAYLLDTLLTKSNDLVISISQMALTDAPNPLKLVEPMNVFTEILASLGIFGATAFIMLIALFIKRVSQAARYDPVLSRNLLVSVLVMLIVLQINQGVFRTYVWVHLAIAFAFADHIVSEYRHRVAQTGC